jgi:hypothetical protein
MVGSFPPINVILEPTAGKTISLFKTCYTNPNKFLFKFSSSPPSPAGEGIYENLLGLALLPDS